MRQTFAFLVLVILLVLSMLSRNRLVLTARESAPESIWLHSESGRGQNSAQE